MIAFIPAAGPPSPRVPPPTSQQVMSYTRSFQDARSRAAGSMLAVGALLHFLAVPIALVLFKAVVESAAGRSVTWDELWGALSVTGFTGLILLGVGAQIAFGIAAAVGSVLAFRGNRGIAVPMIISGVLGLVFSIVVFGGIVGLIGGILIAAGGARARTAAPVLSTPPTYYPPMPPGP